MRGFIKTIRKFYYYYAERRTFFGGLIFVLIAANVLSSVKPYFLKLFVDAIPQLDFKFLLKLLFFYLCVEVAELIFETIAHWLGDFLASHSATKARVDAIGHLQNLDFAFHSSKSTGGLISAIKRGDGAFWTLYYVIHFRILRVFVSFVVMIFFFQTLHPLISMFTFASFVLILGIGLFFVRFNINSRKRFNQEEDNVSGIIVDNIINFETVKLFSKEEWEIIKLKRAFLPWQKRFWGYANSFRFLDISTSMVMILSVFLLFYISLSKTVSMEMTIGDFVLVIGFIGNFYPKLFDLIWGVRDLAKNYADIEKYFGIFDHKVEVLDPKKPVKVDRVNGEISFEDVSFSYKDGKKDALKKVSLDIRQGQSIALVGRSGSGKTTIIKLLMRFYDIDKGKISLDGIDITKFTKSDLRSFMGVVPQKPILFNNTIAYNIGYGNPSAGQKEIEAAAKVANLHDFIKTLRNGYKTNVGERGIKLSGGQKQRLAIARMILSDPDIVVFDEATSHLDSENEKMIQEAFWKAVKNKTTIIIAHRLSTAMRSDKIVVMEDGQIVEEGSHKSLIADKNSLYKYFWDLQVEVD